MGKRVLEIITVPMMYDGMTVFVTRYVGNMRREDVQVDFLAIAEPDERIARTIRDMGCRIHIIEGRNSNPIKYVMQLAKLIRREKYDVVHVHGSSRIIAVELTAAFLGGAKVRVAHSHNTLCTHRLLNVLMTPLFMLMHTHGYACSEDAGKWMFGVRKFTVARIAIPLKDYIFNHFTRVELRRELGIGDQLAVGCVANFEPAKNHSFLIRAFSGFLRINPHAKLFLVGGGRLRSEAEKLVRDLGITDSVVFMGVRDDVNRLLQAFDVMLLPSLYEGFPNVLLEWQCAGLRSMVSDTVTRNTSLTLLTEFMPISEGTKEWVDALTRFVPPMDQERAMLSIAAAASICDKGYDIVTNAREMENFYLNA